MTDLLKGIFKTVSTSLVGLLLIFTVYGGKNGGTFLSRRVSLSCSTKKDVGQYSFLRHNACQEKLNLPISFTVQLCFKETSTPVILTIRN
jgi:hypothetical protein